MALSWHKFGCFTIWPTWKKFGIRFRELFKKSEQAKQKKNYLVQIVKRITEFNHFWTINLVEKLYNNRELHPIDSVTCKFFRLPIWRHPIAENETNKNKEKYSCSISSIKGRLIILFFVWSMMIFHTSLLNGIMMYS